MSRLEEQNLGSHLFATVSGSFKRHLGAVQDAVNALADSGAVVLSPADPKIVDAFGDFVFVNSDLRRSIKGVQSRHLEAIRRSDFLWLVCPDGYVGQSAAMEIGFAAACGTPIFSDGVPLDWTLRQYVTPVMTVASAIKALRGLGGDRGEVGSLLLDPRGTIDIVRSHTDALEAALLGDRRHRADDPIPQDADAIKRALSLPVRQ
jgi:hypothetical protein